MIQLAGTKCRKSVLRTEMTLSGYKHYVKEAYETWVDFSIMRFKTYPKWNFLIRTPVF